MWAYHFSPTLEQLFYTTRDSRTNQAAENKVCIPPAGDAVA